jgi:hypothetical protein
MAPIEFRASSASAVRTHRRHDVGDVVDLQLREGASVTTPRGSESLGILWITMGVIITVAGFKKWMAAPA